MSTPTAQEIKERLEPERTALLAWLERCSEILKPGHQFVALTTAMLAVNKMRDSVVDLLEKKADPQQVSPSSSSSSKPP